LRPLQTYMKYSYLERKIADSLAYTPYLKTIAKRGYRWINYFLFSILSGRKETSTFAAGVGPVSDQSCFFGYYEQCQINKDRKMLICSTPLQNRMPEPNDILTLLWGDVFDKGFRPFSSTHAWNWQQGCMLQWLKDVHGNVVAYNDYQEGRFVSVIRNLDTGFMRRYDRPIYTVSTDGRLALTLNFSRLFRLNPSYGYCNDVVYTLRQKAPSDDGIWYQDLESGTSELVISLRRLSQFESKPTMENAYHKVNHLALSPGRNRFMFIHRWIRNGKKHSRLITANTDGSDLYVLVDDEMVSHCTWKNDRQILSWSRKKGIGDRYFLYTDKSNTYDIIGKSVFNEDGHPSFSPCRRWMVTDTYPDKVQMKSLLLGDSKSHQRIILGRFFSPLKYFGPVRCDLHPRWSADGKYISFDSCHEGIRNSYCIEFDPEKLR